MKTESRKLKPNTVFNNLGDGVRMLRALIDWRRFYFEPNSEMEKRICAAVDAIGFSLLQQVEAAYEPQRRYKVTVRVHKRDTSEHPVYVVAQDELDARDKAYEMACEELGCNNLTGETTINAYKAEEVNENWEAK